MGTEQQVRLDEMRGCPVHDTDGERIGSVEEIFYDADTSKPEWIGIGTGFFGMKRVFVPVEGASIQDDAIFVAYDKDKVKDSPDIDDDEIYGDRERELYAYYGLRYSGPSGEGRARTATSERESVTRAEEELEVGKRETEGGRVRLRKWVETEPVALDVQLRRETARVVREPLDQPVGRDADAFEEKEVEIPLSKEEPVVAKKTVAKERVAVEKDVETERRTVEDEVRKERVEIEGDADER
jgi:uncharacterized protein (TIGR02271 family)